MQIKFYIEKYRLEKNLSLSELAKLSGVSKTYTHSIEAGDRMPSIEVICKLAVALKVPSYFLYSYDE